MKVIEEYLDNLDDELLFEGDGIVSIFSRIKKVKLSSKDKEEGKAKLKEIEASDKYSNVKKAFIKFSKDPSRKASKILSDDLKKELNNYAVAQIGTALGVVFILGFNLPKKLKGKPLGPDFISTLICILAELPPTIISKLFSKSGKTLVEIQRDIEDNSTVSKFSMVEGVVGFLLLIPWLVPAAAGAMIYGAVALTVITLTKMFFSIYIGVKHNRFDQIDKMSKKKTSQMVESIFINIKKRSHTDLLLI